MGKRYYLRALRAARTYTIEEAATALNVTTGTVRNWVKAGLPLMKSRRPFLILGESLRDFLQDRAIDAKVNLRHDQMYCFSCKAPRTPLGRMVDCIPQTDRTARLMGLCEVSASPAVARFGNLAVRMIFHPMVDVWGKLRRV